MLRITFFSANRRTSRLLEVKPPSLNTGWVNRLVVAVVTTRPVSARDFFSPSRIFSRSASPVPNGTTSSSWKLMP